MVKTGVTIFFQGHEHLLARQEKDGVIYQEVPNPAARGGRPHASGQWRAMPHGIDGIHGIHGIYGSVVSVTCRF